MFKLQSKNVIPIESAELESGASALIINNPDAPDDYIVIMRLDEEGITIYPDIKSTLYDWGYKDEIIESITWNEDGGLAVNRAVLSDETQEEIEEES